MKGPFVVTVEGADELARNWQFAAYQLERDTEMATLHAADAAVAEMQANHPYEDQTYNLSGGMHAVPQPAEAGDRETEYVAEIEIPAEYASFVDKGTSHAKPYPFTPRGERVAERDVTREERAAVDRFERSAVRG